MNRYHIRLDTMTEAARFANICEQIPHIVRLEDGEGNCVNAKSVLGCLYSMEFMHIYCMCEYDIYHYITSFVVD